LEDWGSGGCAGERIGGVFADEDWEDGPYDSGGGGRLN
jgi:hypothetical protein